METVKNLDLTKYAGLWYEISAIKTKYQPKDGTNSRATYTLNGDQTLGVLNETWIGGKRSSIEGKAWKGDAKSEDAKLKVRFWVPPFLPAIPVTGDYWVLDLERENYSYALVGEPAHKSLWVLSRTPVLSDDIYDKLMEKAKIAGYDIGQVQKTPQPEGVVESSTGDDTKGSWWHKAHNEK